MNLRALLCVSLMLVASVSFAAESPTTAEDPPRGHNALRKLGRGCANVLFGIVEIPNQASKARSEHGGAGLAYGIPKGFVRFIGRELVGVYEIVTFPIPAPKGYRPVLQPEWPNEDIEP